MQRWIRLNPLIKSHSSRCYSQSSSPSPSSSLSPLQIQTRNLFSKFPQPVVIVTAIDEKNGRARGITVSSFTSLSLEPPRVMFNIKTPSRALDAMKHRFAAHFLGADGESIAWAKRFASNEADHDREHGGTGVEGGRWEGEACWSRSKDGIPVYKGASGTILCETEREIHVGDHVIVVGRVTATDGHKGSKTGLVWQHHSFRHVGPIVKSDTATNE